MSEQKTEVEILREGLKKIVNLDTDNKTTPLVQFVEVWELAIDTLAEAEKAPKTFTIEDVEGIAREAVENCESDYSNPDGMSGVSYSFFDEFWWQQKKKELLGGKG
jgi:hypothetical protein